MKKTKKILLWAKLLCIVSGVLIIGMLLSLLYDSFQQNKYYEYIAMNNDTEITEEVLQKLSELQGIQCVSVIAVYPVHISIGEYEMDTVLKGVDLDEFPVKIKNCEKETQIGSKVPLFLESGSLDNLEDGNRKKISTKQKQALWDQEAETVFLITPEGTITKEEKEFMSNSDTNTSEEPKEQTRAQTGIRAAALQGEGEQIYIPFAEGHQMAEFLAIEPQGYEFYLRIKGKKNTDRIELCLLESGFLLEEL